MRRWLLLVVFFAGAYGASAQPFVTYTGTLGSQASGNEYVRSLIRNWNDQYAVAYQCYKQAGTTQYDNSLSIVDIDPFLTAPASGISLSMETGMMTGVSPQVMDMHVVGHYLFFCGAIDAYPCGFVGYLDLNQMGGQQMNLEVGLVTAAASLKRLTAYADAGSYHIVAIGEDQQGESVIVEVPDVFTSISNNVCDYLFTTLPSSGYEQEILEDVYFMDNGIDKRVVFAGRIESAYYHYNDIAIRVADNPENVISSASIADRWEYPTGNSEINLSLRAAKAKDDYLYVAYVTYDNATMLRTRTFDLTTMTNIHSQQFWHDEKWDPMEMVFLGIGKMEMLLPHSWQNVVVESDPFVSGGYQADYRYKGGKEYSTIDEVWGDRIMMLYDKELYLQDMYNQPTINPCKTSDVLYWYYVPNLQFITQSIPLQVMPMQDPGQSVTIPMFTSQIIYPCYEY